SALTTITAELEAANVYMYPDVVLERALDSSLPLGRMAWLATAASLLARSPDYPRLGADILVKAIGGARFDPDAFGEALGWLLQHGFGNAGRLAPPLRDVARVSPLHRAQVVRAVAALVDALDAK